jgi:hypothetical protein
MGSLTQPPSGKGYPFSFGSGTFIDPLVAFQFSSLQFSNGFNSSSLNSDNLTVQDAFNPSINSSLGKSNIRLNNISGTSIEIGDNSINRIGISNSTKINLDSENSAPTAGLPTKRLRITVNGVDYFIGLTLA